MNSRILATSEGAYIERSAEHIGLCVEKFQRTRPGAFLLGISCGEGHIRRCRTVDVLRALALREEIDWARVVVFLADEALDASKADECGAALLRESLLKPLEGRGAQLRPGGGLVVPDASLPWEECAAEYERRLQELFALHGPPSLMVLSLAPDFSVASLFPQWYLDDPERWAQATQPSFGVLPTEKVQGVSRHVCVNLRIIRESANIVVFVGGKRGKGTSLIQSEIGLAEQTFPAGEEAADIVAALTAAAPLVMSRSPRGNQQNLSRSLSEAPRGPRHLFRGNSSSATTSSRRLHHAGSQREMVLADEVPASPLTYILKFCHVCIVELVEDRSNHHSIVVFGAAGDLAKKKTLPALYNLYLARVLPPNVSIVCCDDVDYHKDLANIDDLWNNRLKSTLLKEGHESDLNEFRRHLEFVPIKFGNDQSMEALDSKIKGLAGGLRDNRIFYLALPPFMFEAAVAHIRNQCWPEGDGYIRVIVEKPFGRDLASAQELSAQINRHLAEQQIYRIDHYLAKTMTMNILTLRFANRELGRLFHADNVANVRITFKENIGVEGRAGYFDSYGIIRDVMQNHLLQLLTLVTMEAPASLNAEDVRNEKVKVLKQIRPVELDDCAVGQYEDYQDDPDIQALNKKRGYKTRCPTFAVCVLYLDNERWSNVPLIFKAGKAVDQRSTIVRLQFKKAPPHSLFGDQPQNELVMRIQPNESIYYRMLAKTPGLAARSHEVQRTMLNLDLRSEAGRMPDAYEKLIHDVFQGESHNFVRADEVEEGWRIFDPLLKQLESEDAPVPPSYARGSRGPLHADELINSTGFRRYTKTGVAGFAQDNFQ